MKGKYSKKDLHHDQSSYMSSIQRHDSVAGGMDLPEGYNYSQKNLSNKKRPQVKFFDDNINERKGSMQQLDFKEDMVRRGVISPKMQLKSG